MDQVTAGEELINAVKQNEIEAVKIILPNNSKIVDFQDSNGWTPLYWASELGYVDIVKVLLDFGADVDLPTNDLNTPLHPAAKYGHVEVVNALVLANASVDFVNSDGKTSLWRSCNEQKLEVFRVLLAAGANPFLPAKNGKKPYDVAKNLEIKSILNDLLEECLQNKEINKTRISTILKNGFVHWNRSKLVIVGSGRAGKTALTNSLLGKKFFETTSTIGINENSCSLYRNAVNVKKAAWKEGAPKDNFLEREIARLIVASYTKDTKAEPSIKENFANDTIISSSDLGTSNSSELMDASESSVRSNDIKTSSLNNATKSYSVDSESGNINTSLPSESIPIDEDIVFKYIGEKSTDSNLILSIYDFGGQQIFNTIHHLFITKTGVYAIVFNMEWLCGDAATADATIKYLLFWMNSIVMHTYDGKRTAPIVFVGTRKDIVALPEEHEKISNMLFEACYHNAAWSSVIENAAGVGVNGTITLWFFPVDNTVGDQDISIKNLMTAVESNILQSSLIQQTKPISWIKCLDKLLSAKKQYLKLNDVFLMTKEFGLSDSNTVQFLQFLHDSGFILWYNDELLRDNIVIDAVRFLVQPTTVIICKHTPGTNDNTVHLLDIHKKCRAKYYDDWLKLTQYGIVSGVLLESLLEDYEEKEHIIKLMIKFNFLVLFTKHDKTEYIVPALLPALLDSKFKELKSVETKSTCYYYFSLADHMINNTTIVSTDLLNGYLPDGLFERLLCSLIDWCRVSGTSSHVSSDMFTVYKNAGIFYFGGQKIVLIEHKEYNCIELGISGRYPIAAFNRINFKITEIIREYMKGLLFTCALSYPIENTTDEFVDHMKQSILIPRQFIYDIIIKKSSIISKKIPGNTNLITSEQALDMYSKWFILNQDKIDSDIFISYRWGARDSYLVTALYDFFAMTTIENGRPLNVFLDFHILRDGKQFLRDIVNALTATKFTVPIISADSLQRLTTHDSSLIDNMLLEWIIILHLSEADHTRRICPIFFGTSSENYDQQLCNNLFSEEIIDLLPKVIPQATIELAKLLLDQVQVTYSASIDHLTVHGIVSAFRKYLGILAWTIQPSIIVEDIVKRVISILNSMTTAEHEAQLGAYHSNAKHTDTSRKTTFETGIVPASGSNVISGEVKSWLLNSQLVECTEMFNHFGIHQFSDIKHFVGMTFKELDEYLPEMTKMQKIKFHKALKAGIQ